MFYLFNFHIEKLKWIVRLERDNYQVLSLEKLKVNFIILIKWEKMLISACQLIITKLNKFKNI